MTDENKAIEVLSKAIKEVVLEMLKTASFDRTLQGIIVSKNMNVYNVRIDDSIYSIKSLHNFNINEVVWVTLPLNNATNMFLLPNK